MKVKNLKSINELHYQIKAHSDISSEKALRSLWIEVPDHCHLHCPYCFANTQRNKPHHAKDTLTSEEHISLLRSFREHGGQFLGIPGLGEPFHPANRALILEIVEEASNLGLQTTVFTTGEALFWEMEPLRSYSDIVNGTSDFFYADQLLKSNVILLVKVNSFDPNIQDQLVSQPGYTVARNMALNCLIDRYKLNSSKRLGIVTSIMPENINQIDSLYEYARKKNLIFDCDTILPRGRGDAFQKAHSVTCQEVRTIFHNIVKQLPGGQYGGGSYIGSSCDRVRHHLYVDIHGNAYPCIGCVGRNENLNLGNIRKRKLIDIWNDPLRLKIRNDYPSMVLGICSYCENFEKECLSCLGRWVKKYEFFADGPVLITVGCHNHRPDLNLWITRCAKFIRSQISSAPIEIRKTIRDDIAAYGLEVFWKCLPKNLLKAESLTENIFPLIKKDVTYSDLNIPFRNVWDLIDPDKLKSIENRQDVINSLIPRTLLTSLQLLADRHDHGFIPSSSGLAHSGKGNIQFCNMMFYQHHMNRGFYRTVTHNTLDNRVLERPEHDHFVRDNSENAEKLQNEIEMRNRAVRLWQRWVETFEDKQGAIGLLVPHIADFSRLMEEERVDTYELILDNSLFKECLLSIRNDIVYGGECVLNVANIIDSALIQNKLVQVYDVVKEMTTNEPWKKIEEVLSRLVFAYADEVHGESLSLLREVFKKMSDSAFYPTDRRKIPENELSYIENELQQILRESIVSQLSVPQSTKDDEIRFSETLRKGYASLSAESLLLGLIYVKQET